MIHYLTADDIRVFHEVALDGYSGAGGEHEPGQIEFMADKPAMVTFGQELYPGLFLKATVYMHGFATRQFFVFGDDSLTDRESQARLFMKHFLNGYSSLTTSIHAG